MSSFSQNAKMAWTVTCAIGDFAGRLVRHGQSLLIYPGAKAFFPEMAQEIVSPDVFGLPYEMVQLCCSDKVNIEACLILNPNNHLGLTVALFHGNGANYSMQLPMARAFWSMGCHCFLLSYRGFGQSSGTPTEKGLRRDAAAAMEFISSHPTLSQTKLILYGQSLGGAVAIDTASRFPSKVAGLILENTFLSIVGYYSTEYQQLTMLGQPKMIPAVMPALASFSWLCAQKWPSEDSIKLVPYNTPILFLSGSKDEVVPNSHMHELYKISCTRQHHVATGSHSSTLNCSRQGSRERVHDTSTSTDNATTTCDHRVMKVFENGQHNDTFLCEGYWMAVRHFLHFFEEPAEGESHDVLS